MNYIDWSPVPSLEIFVSEGQYQCRSVIADNGQVLEIFELECQSESSISLCVWKCEFNQCLFVKGNFTLVIYDGLSMSTVRCSGYRIFTKSETVASLIQRKFQTVDFANLQMIEVLQEEEEESDGSDSSSKSFLDDESTLSVNMCCLAYSTKILVHPDMLKVITSDLNIVVDRNGFRVQGFHRFRPTIGNSCVCVEKESRLTLDIDLEPMWTPNDDFEHDDNQVLFDSLARSLVS